MFPLFAFSLDFVCLLGVARCECCIACTIFYSLSWRQWVLFIWQYIQYFFIEEHLTTSYDFYVYWQKLNILVPGMVQYLWDREPGSSLPVLPRWTPCHETEHQDSPPPLPEKPRPEHATRCWQHYDDIMTTLLQRVYSTHVSYRGLELSRKRHIQYCALLNCRTFRLLSGSGRMKYCR